ncbi:MAG: tRNA 2-thiouridine(34) synthase MnmA [Anaerolineae bacterium]
MSAELEHDHSNSELGRERVIVAMSGGVDSATAAALLVEQGFEVTGVMMRLWAEETGDGLAHNRCCSPQAVEDARSVCQQLGIPFYLLNFEREFKAAVVDYFCDEYEQGRTPNPCLACNRHIKFHFLLNKARALGANYLATGHYARVRKINGRYQLLKGVDPAKDQSYALYMLGQEELRHLLFPLGGYTKEQVRGMATEWGLPVARKPESQEICFVPDNDYRRFLRSQRPGSFRPGPIVDHRGCQLGIHQGLPAYTIGQRRGLGISAGEPLYVLKVDTTTNTLLVGGAHLLGQSRLTAREVNLVEGGEPRAPLEITAKIRYKAVETAAKLVPLGGTRVEVIFEQPQRAITPGQAVVFYQGQLVVGGGIIEQFLSSSC